MKIVNKFRIFLVTLWIVLFFVLLILQGCAREKERTKYDPWESQEYRRRAAAVIYYLGRQREEKAKK